MDTRAKRESCKYKPLEKIWKDFLQFGGGKCLKTEKTLTIMETMTNHTLKLNILLT